MLNSVGNWLKERDYRLKSVRVYRFVFITVLTILTITSVLEVLVDFKSTTPEIIFTFTGIFYLLALLHYLKVNDLIIRMGMVITSFFFFEYIFLTNTQAFHIIHYWFCLVTLLALIVLGLRASFITMIASIIAFIINSQILANEIGDSYSIIVHRIPFTYASILFLIAVTFISIVFYSLLGEALSNMKSKSEELDKLHKQSIEKNGILKRYQASIIKLSKEQSIYTGNVEDVSIKIIREVVENLRVSRVSIWKTNDDHSKIIRQFLFEKGNQNEEEIELHKNDFPRYFEALEKHQFISADNAHIHPDTRDFSEVYLKPLGIESMLDCPIIIDQKLYGVICCEHQGEFKTWSTEDILFIQSITEFLGLSFKNSQVKELLKKLREQNNTLHEKHNEILTMNEELHSLNEELNAINDNLEATVKERTSELEKQNEQLTEYAFINSHMLRAPLTRIMGLSDILMDEATGLKENELLKALHISTNEMDAIIRRISDLLYEGYDFSREDIKEIIHRNLYEES